MEPERTTGASRFRRRHSSARLTSPDSLSSSGIRRACRELQEELAALHAGSTISPIHAASGVEKLTAIVGALADRIESAERSARADAPSPSPWTDVQLGELTRLTESCRNVVTILSLDYQHSKDALEHFRRWGREIDGFLTTGSQDTLLGERLARAGTDPRSFAATSIGCGLGAVLMNRAVGNYLADAHDSSDPLRPRIAGAVDAALLSVDVQILPIRTGRSLAAQAEAEPALRLSGCYTLHDRGQILDRTDDTVVRVDAYPVIWWDRGAASPQPHVVSPGSVLIAGRAAFA